MFVMALVVPQDVCIPTTRQCKIISLFTIVIDGRSGRSVKWEVIQMYETSSVLFIVVGHNAANSFILVHM